MNLQEFKTELNYDNGIVAIQPKQVYEWVKTGSITRKEFEQYIASILEYNSSNE